MYMYIYVEESIMYLYMLKKMHSANKGASFKNYFGEQQPSRKGQPMWVREDDSHKLSNKTR